MISLRDTSLRACTIVAAIIYAHPSVALDLRGQLQFEHRYFISQGNQGEPQNHPSVAAELDIFHQWMTDLSFNVKPFIRHDVKDQEKSNMDFRAFSLTYAFSDYELKIGLAKEFWGVTESQNLVDIINQTDTMESFEEDVKLGQPMVKASYFTEGGLAEAFLLPYFRERRFPGDQGRLKPPIPTSEHSRYESSQEEKHLDLAFRYSHTFDSYDLGFSYFKGTGREPLFVLVNNKLTPYYIQISQFGLDLQAPLGNTLLKLEAINRRTHDETFNAHTVGFEHTFVGAMDSNWDIGWILEHLYDSRGKDSTGYAQNDLFIGLRVNPNDTNGSEALLGLFQDLENQEEYVAKIEASSRIGSNWRFNVEAWAFNSHASDSVLHSISNDDFIQIAFNYYF